MAHCPDVLAAVAACVGRSQRAQGRGLSQIALDPGAFEGVPSISVDHAVMERFSRVAVVPCDIGWSDIGSLSAASELTEPDGSGNRIDVKPESSLSLQMHHHRSEHRIVVSGEATVVSGEREFVVRANESIYIPAQTRHRLSNISPRPLSIIEVPSGTYLGEDDIVRFADIHSRVTAA